MIGLELNHFGFTYGESDIDLVVDRRPQYAGDAIFIPDFDLNEISEEKRYRMRLILLCFGFMSLGNYLIKSSGIIQQGIEEILNKIFKKRFGFYWNRIPRTLYSYVKN